MGDVSTSRARLLEIEISADRVNHLNNGTYMRQLPGSKTEYFLPYSSAPRTPVCSTMWLRVLGLSRHTLRLVAQQQGLRKHHHGNQGRKYHTKAEVSLICNAFWSWFYGVYCQRPNENLRLWPSNLTLKWIYDTQFCPFMQRQYPDSIVPCTRTFEQCASDPEDFVDVMRRKKHHHLRCFTCALLSAKLLKALREGEDPTPARKAREEHDLMVLRWRKLEAVVKTNGRLIPSQNLVMLSDDTDAIGFPHFSNRDYKVGPTPSPTPPPLSYYI